MPFFGGDFERRSFAEGLEAIASTISFASLFSFGFGELKGTVRKFLQLNPGTISPNLMGQGFKFDFCSIHTFYFLCLNSHAFVFVSPIVKAVAVELGFKEDRAPSLPFTLLHLLKKKGIF